MPWLTEEPMMGAYSVLGRYLSAFSALASIIRSLVDAFWGQSILF